MTPAKQNGNVVPLRPRRSRREDDFLLPAPKKRPFVKPGRYVGATTTVTKRNYHGAREYLEIAFDLWDNADALANGEAPVARGIPGYFNLSGGPASRYALLLQLIFPGASGPRHASDLIGKYLEVEVVTVEQDSEENTTPEDLHYSKVSQVLARAS